MTASELLHAAVMAFRSSRRFPQNHIFYARMLSLGDVIDANSALANLEIGRVPPRLNAIANVIYDAILPELHKRGLPTKDAEDVMLMIREAAHEVIAVNLPGPKYRRGKATR